MSPSSDFCSNCGAQLRPNAKFCPNCGKQVINGQAAAPIPSSSPPIPPTAATPSTSFSPPAQPVAAPVSARESQPAEAIPLPSTPISPQKPHRARWVIPAVITGLCLCGIVLGAGVMVGYRMINGSLDLGWLSSATSIVSPSETIPSLPTTSSTPPPVTPSDSPLPSPSLPVGGLVEFEGIRFAYDPILARNISPQIVPGQENPSNPFFDLYPQHFQFTFIGYPLIPNAFHTPKLYIYPVESYSSLNSAAASIITELQEFLQLRPSGPYDKEIPFLPIFNAAQMMRSNVRFLEFQNGIGVRFLTQYGQAAYPINNQNLFYTFQGLTNQAAGQQQYYIAAIFPVANPMLPNAAPSQLPENFDENFPLYLKETGNLLDIQADNSFSPALNLLDALVQSISVNR